MTVNVCVFCGASDGNESIYKDTAFEFGQRLAAEGFGLVYGAGGTGIMGAVSDGALSEGGYVHGIIPEDMILKEWGRPDLSRLEPVSDIQMRKKRMYEESRVLVTLPGGFGTFEELFESVTWSQLGLHAEPKQSYILNVNGYYDDLRRQVNKAYETGFVKPGDRSLVRVVDTIGDLMACLDDHK